MRVDLSTRAGGIRQYNVYQAYRLFLSERILEPAVLSLVVIFPLFR